MQRTAWVTALFALLSIPLTGCSVASDPHSNQPDLNPEIANVAKQFINNVVLQCGDVSYMSYAPNGIRALKGFTYVVHQDPISEADRLNGYEWKARINVGVVASRFRSNYYKTWGPWERGIGFFGWMPMFEKKNGKITGQVSGPDKTRPQDCGHVPQ